MSITLILFLMATQPHPSNLNAVPVLAEPVNVQTQECVDAVREARESTGTLLRTAEMDSRGGVHPYPGYSPADVFAAVVAEDEAKQNDDKPWTEPTPLPGNSMTDRLKERR